MTRRAADKRALRILSSTFWSSSGWKHSPDIASEDFAYAKSAGVMFDPRRINHDQKVDWAISCRSRISKRAVTNAFLASLTSRRLDWRSALGSFAVSLNLPLHSWSRKDPSPFNCGVCGLYDKKNLQEDLNVLNFERFKWGGVRHTDPLYIGFDLEQFLLEEPIEPKEADVKLMKEVLNLARSSPRDAKLSFLVKALSKILPSNAYERRTVIGILGFCGILEDSSKPGFFKGFPPYSRREEVRWCKNDWPYPVQWWNGSCGVSDEAAAFWFPEV
jgi:hypothetical protein